MQKIVASKSGLKPLKTKKCLLNIKMTVIEDRQSMIVKRIGKLCRVSNWPVVIEMPCKEHSEFEDCRGKQPFLKVCGYRAHEAQRLVGDESPCTPAAYHSAILQASRENFL